MSSPPPRAPLLTRPATGAGVTIALVDSGIYAGHPHITREVEQAVRWSDEEGTFLPSAGDVHGHGTALAAAMLRYAPDARLLSVGVLDQNLETSGPIAAAGILQAIELGARIVNVSLGTENLDHIEIFEEVLAAAVEAGVLVVAAAHPRAGVTLPADLTGAISAMSNPMCPPLRYYDAPVLRLDADGQETRLDRFLLHGVPRRGAMPMTKNFRGTSVAAAHLSGLVARILEEIGQDASRQEVLAALRSGSCGRVPPPGSPL